MERGKTPPTLSRKRFFERTKINTRKGGFDKVTRNLSVCEKEGEGGGPLSGAEKRKGRTVTE